MFWQKIQDRARIVDSALSPEFFATDLEADFIQEAPGAPAGLPVPQFLGENGRELNSPLAQGFVADLNAALSKHFLDVSLAEGEAVTKPKSAYWMMLSGNRCRQGLRSITDNQPAALHLPQPAAGRWPSPSSSVTAASSTRSIRDSKHLTEFVN